MGKFKFSENNPITDVKKTKNYNPDAVITKQPPIFLDDANTKGESFNTWLTRMNTEIYHKYDVTLNPIFGGKSMENFDKLELKNMFYRNTEAAEFYKIVKEHIYGNAEKSKDKSSIYNE